jgi:Zn-dependent alcohol dehydrogenase
VWKGSAFGGVKGRTELPGIVDDYLAGKLWVDQFVTHTQGLEDINKGFEDMKVGHCGGPATLRPLISGICQCNGTPLLRE